MHFFKIMHSFADTFHTLEAEGILDPLNEADMFCLHYIFLPRIAKSLKEFQESWYNHPLSTEGNLTPYQLFFEGTNIMLNDGDSDIDLTHLQLTQLRLTQSAFHQSMWLYQ